ncbi:PhoH family protein [[Brevibacterium] frigoritolerans]|nr:PhoH family protein [Peribacillus frigoritolerans]
MRHKIVIDNPQSFSNEQCKLIMERMDKETKVIFLGEKVESLCIQQKGRPF